MAKQRHRLTEVENYESDSGGYIDRTYFDALRHDGHIYLVNSSRTDNPTRAAFLVMREDSALNTASASKIRNPNMVEELERLLDADGLEVDLDRKPARRRWETE